MVLLPRTALLAIVAAATLLACGKPPATGETPPPEVTLYGVQMTHYREANVAVTGRAARVTYRRSTGEMVAYESFFRFPNRRERPKKRRGEPPGMELRAPIVVGNLGSKTAEAQGGVLLKSTSGIVGTTDRVSFDGAGLSAKSETRTHVTGPGYTLDADRFTLLFTPEEFTFEGTVESRLGGAQ